MNQKETQHFLLAISMALASTAHHLSIASSNSAPTGAAVALADKEKNTKETREAFLLECKEKRQWYQELVTPQDVRSVLANQDTFSKLLAAYQNKHKALNTYNGYKQEIDYNTFSAIIAGLNLGTPDITTIIKQYCRTITDLSAWQSPHPKAICIELPSALSMPILGRQPDSPRSPNRALLFRTGLYMTKNDQRPRLSMALVKNTKNPDNDAEQKKFEVHVRHTCYHTVYSLWAPNSESLALSPSELSQWSSPRQVPDSAYMLHFTPDLSMIKPVAIAAEVAHNTLRWSWSPDSLLLALPEAAKARHMKHTISIITRQGISQQKLEYDARVVIDLPLAWSADSRYLAAACSAHNTDVMSCVLIFNVVTGTLEKTVSCSRPLAAIAWSDQESILAIVNSERGIDIYSAHTKQSHRLEIVGENRFGNGYFAAQWHDMHLRLAYLNPCRVTRVHELAPVYPFATEHGVPLELLDTDKLFSKVINISCARRVLGLVGKSSDTI